MNPSSHSEPLALLMLTMLMILAVMLMTSSVLLLTALDLMAMLMQIMMLMILATLMLMLSFPNGDHHGGDGDRKLTNCMPWQPSYRKCFDSSMLGEHTTRNSESMPSFSATSSSRASARAHRFDHEAV